MQAELAECGERMEKKQEEWKEQKQRLLDEIELEKKAKLDFEDQLSQMKTNAATIHKVAKDAASIDVKKLEGKLAEAQASIDTLKQQLLAKTHDLKAMENSRDAAESRVLEKEKHRQDDYACDASQVGDMRCCTERRTSCSKERWVLFRGCTDVTAPSFG